MDGLGWRVSSECLVRLTRPDPTLEQVYRNYAADTFASLQVVLVVRLQDSQECLIRCPDDIATAVLASPILDASDARCREPSAFPTEHCGKEDTWAQRDGILH